MGGGNMHLERVFGLWLGLGLALMATAVAFAQAPRLAAPNVVEISPQLVTSAQPTVSDAVRDEQLIVTRQGLTFINIPIAFDNPTEADFDNFSSLLNGLAGRKVLVHCQVNLRASSMVFLYRTIVRKEEPRVAYQAVTGVWSPDGPWRRLIEAQLRKHKIAFELL